MSFLTKTCLAVMKTQKQKVVVIKDLEIVNNVIENQVREKSERKLLIGT